METNIPARLLELQTPKINQVEEYLRKKDTTHAYQLMTAIYQKQNAVFQAILELSAFIDARLEEQKEDAANAAAA